MKYFLSVLLLHITFLLVGQVADFESYDIAPSGFINNTIDSDTLGYFEGENILLPNVYDANYDFWTGWAISSATDTLTPGFTNQYSAIAGGGYDGSVNYAVGYAASPIQMHIQDPYDRVSGIYVTNNAYAYLSMRDGDAFAKKFGGVTGDDPDFFKLTVRAWYEGEVSTDSIDFYLADFRFENNAEDYIIDEWTYLDLSEFALIDSLQFELTSSDVGQFGMNTPAYFCIDNVETDKLSSTSNLSQQIDVNLFPNPVQSQLEVSIDEENVGFEYGIYNYQGQQVNFVKVLGSHTKIDTESLDRGSYLIVVKNDKGIRTLPFVKM